VNDWRLRLPALFRDIDAAGIVVEKLTLAPCRRFQTDGNLPGKVSGRSMPGTICGLPSSCSEPPFILHGTAVFVFCPFCPYLSVSADKMFVDTLRNRFGQPKLRTLWLFLPLRSPRTSPCAVKAPGPCPEKGLKTPVGSWWRPVKVYWWACRTTNFSRWGGVNSTP